MTHADIIDSWPSMAAFGRDAGIPYQSVRKYRDHDWIPTWWWPDVIAAAAKQGLRGVSYESLARMAAQRHRGRARRRAA